MTITNMQPLSIYRKNMSKQYERQLLIARRLARIRRLKLFASGESELPDPEIMRKETVRRVANELYQSLLYTESDNPVARAVRENLNAVIGEQMHFMYMPGEEGVHLVKENIDGFETITDPEQSMVLKTLWEVTKKTVDQCMV